MRESKVPERLVWVVESLAVDPTDRLLEIGCGKPDTTRTADVVDKLAASLVESGLSIDDVTPPSPDSAHMLRVTARA